MASRRRDHTADNGLNKYLIATAHDRPRIALAALEAEAFLTRAGILKSLLRRG